MSKKYALLYIIDGSFMNFNIVDKRIHFWTEKPIHKLENAKQIGSELEIKALLAAIMLFHSDGETPKFTENFFEIVEINNEQAVLPT